eukprot:TRINITY_DN18441_c0_g1_i1.p1 TRINITY_DN18441_c0_g1~~TRINITY_DN18441_c0_g1_i1.p1  ORF type:complete len:368 (-),score=59.40 TRINITY_DN18441_c0_g1_i1:100-1203(-)
MLHMYLLYFVFFKGYGDHRDLHYPLRRQRQMCIRDRSTGGRYSEHALMAQAALLNAVRKGDEEDVRQQIKLGADPNVQIKGLSALHHAVKSINMPMVQLLCEQLNADENLKDPQGATPLDYAKVQCRGCNVSMEIVAYLTIPRIKRRGKRQAPLTTEKRAAVEVHPDALLRNAAQVGDEDRLRSALALGADVHGRNEFGATALHLAASADHSSIARILVTEFNAEVSMTKNWGDTALHWACAEGHTEMVRVLVEELGADAGLANHTGATPLHFAAYYGQFEIVRVLVEEIGADMNATNNIGKTALEMSMIEEVEDETLNSRRRDVTSYLLLLLEDDEQSEEEPCEGQNEAGRPKSPSSPSSHSSRGD